MEHPLKNLTKTAPLQNNLRDPHTVDAVVVLHAPTWEEYKTRVHFTDEYALFFKAMFRKLAPLWKVRFLYACPHPTPGNRPLFKEELDACVDFLGESLAVFNCPVLLCGASGLRAAGLTQYKAHHAMGSYLTDDIFCILDPRDVFKDPFLYRNFRWQLERFIKHDVPTLHTPTQEYMLIDSYDAIPGELRNYRGHVAFDIEATGTNFKKDSLTAVGLGTRKGTYIFTVNALQDKRTHSFFRAYFRRNDLTFVAHNAKFDMKWLMEHLGIHNRLVQDTMLMHGCINEGGAGKPMPGMAEDSAMGHGLKLLSRLYLGWGDYEKDVEYNPTTPEQWTRLYGYLALDLRATMELHDILIEQLDERMWELYTYFLDLSMVMTWVEWRGVRFDVAKAMEIRDELNTVERSLTERMDTIIGFGGVNYNSTKQIAKLLYESPHVFPSYPKQYKDGSVTTEADSIRHLLEKSATGGWGTKRDWFVATLLEYRKVTKLRATYIDGLLAQVDDNGYIHTEFKLVAVVTGRLSSAKPNLQNQPAPYTALGKTIRGLFLPDVGHRWISADLSQAELRTVAYYSDDENMQSVYLGDGDLHTMTTLTAYPVAASLNRKSKEFKQLRKAAKIVNFGVIYGMLAQALMDKINNVDVETTYGIITVPADVQITKKEAQKWIDAFFTAYPQVREYMEREVTEVFSKGYSTTPLHHRRYLGMVPRDPKVRSEVTNHLYNYKIQGTAGMLTLIAGIRMHKWLDERGYLDNGLASLTLTVHDEWNLTAHESVWREVAKQAKYFMETTPSTYLPNLKIPFTSDLEVGYNWGNMEGVKEE